MEGVMRVEVVKLATLYHTLEMNKPTSSTMYNTPTTFTLTLTIQLGRTIQILHGATTSNSNPNHLKRRK